MRHRNASFAVVKVLALVAGLAAPAAAWAQATPQIVVVPADTHPTIPSGMQLACWGAPTPAPSSTCPVIQYGDITTWAFSFQDNRFAYGLVSYDAQGKVVRSVVRNGARYVYKMTTDPAAQTISIWGQGDAKVDVAWADLPQIPPRVVIVSATTAPPPPPPGMMVVCMTSVTDERPSPTCPMIAYRGHSTWAFSFQDNRFAFGVATYDAQAHPLKIVTRPGARYVYKITIEPAAQTVTLWGQHDMTIVVPWSELP
ncbi:MAG: hypothetical protein JWP92_2361 [Caulobacter sp.]|nr:hypothetical protein [Caulobacter sp.]